MNSFRCFRVYSEAGVVRGRLETSQLEDLQPGSVVIKALFSSINYKDALGATGTGKILRRFPLIAGIDVAGEVITSEDSRFRQGQLVLVTGCGLGEDHDGGYSEVVRVPGDWIVPLPQGLTPTEAMTLGTAGFTAALCLHRLEQNGQQPNQGAVVVTGASGGVGMLAVQILSQRGYRVIAVSGKPSAQEFLRELGAHQVCHPQDLPLGQRPLEAARWAGAIDNVGGELLSGLLRHIDLWGNVASVGMASDHHLDTTVFPFILRGVSLLGISSTNCPMPLRQQLWQRLATDWKPHALARSVSRILSLNELDAGFTSLLSRQNQGRILVDCQKS